MSKESKIRLIILISIAVLVLTLFLISNKKESLESQELIDNKAIESNETTHDEEEKTSNTNNEEEILNVENIELKFGDKARISEEEIKNLYSEDVDLLLLANKLIGHPAPNLKFTSLEGEELSINSFKGENIIIEFMGTWCPVCEESTKDVKKFSEISDTRIIPIGLGDNSKSLKGFMRDFDVNEIAHYYADTDTVLDTYEIFFVPIYFYIDKEGYVQIILAGSAEADMLEEFAIKVFD